VLGADRVQRGVEGQVEVGPGVAVGDGEDVERVDLGASGGERRPGEHGPAPRVGCGEGVEHGGRLVAGAVTGADLGTVLVAAARLGYS
jgi:hypothetical protein